MYCPNCGTEIYLTDHYNNVKYTYCEKCNHVFSTKNYGPLPEVIAEKQQRFQEQFEKEAKKNTSIKEVISKLSGIQKPKQVKMHHPKDRVDQNLGKIVTRYTYRNVKGA